MKITVFTSNRPRHLALIECLAKFATRVFAVQECSHPFEMLGKSTVLTEYFSRVSEAEATLFGNIRFLSEKVSQLAIANGELSNLPLTILQPAMDADAFIVFGASYIKGPLCDMLIHKGALNIHMGVSPYYRGSATNFWALYDGHPEYVGATIHKLGKGLDSGPILAHVFPPVAEYDPFLFGMKAVQAAHESIAIILDSCLHGRITEAVPQDRSRQIRYSRTSDFTEEVVNQYQGRLPTPQCIRRTIANRNLNDFVNPLILELDSASSPQAIPKAS
jgi:hypothetical protein